MATYDDELGAPKCLNVGSSCSSGELLLKGKQSPNFGNNKELNSSHNTIGTCTDGRGGSFHNDESIDEITVSAVGGNGLPEEGRVAKIQAKVWAWSSGVADRADFYYASNANDPEWIHKGTLTPGRGLQTLSVEYTIPAGSMQAVRVNFRYSGSTSPCTGGYWDDVDDLIFPVAAASAKGAVSAGVKPVPVPADTPMTSDICKTIQKKEKSRCNDLDMCKMRGNKCLPIRKGKK